MVEYKVVPFSPAVGASVQAASTALEQLIAGMSSQGWEYVELASHWTVVPGSSGCFGWGATDPYPVTMSMAVFRK